MRKFLVPCLLLLAIGGLLFAAYKIQGAAESPPPYKEAVRESRPLLPLLFRRAGAVVETRISVRSLEEGQSPLARALRNGILLRIQGTVAPRYSDLAFSLRSGSGEARWQELRLGERSALVVGGTPYRSGKSFLDNDWARALNPDPLLWLWKKDLPRRALPLPGEENFWAYRTLRPLQLPVALLQILGPGSTDLLFRKSDGSPGGVRYQTRSRNSAALLGVSPQLLPGDVRWQVDYRILRWGAPTKPRLPNRLYPRGDAALQTALLPFYTGLAE